MTKINTVTINARTIDLYAFTGEVIDQSTSTHTQSTLHANNQVTTYTDSYSNLFVKGKDGEERSLQVANMNIGVRQGNTVSLLWGIKKGREKGDYIAVYNHDTKAIHHIRKGNNDTAGPMGYNMLLIVGVLIGVLGAASLIGGDFWSIITVAIGAGLIYWIYKRQKKLMAAVDAAARSISV